MHTTLNRKLALVAKAEKYLQGLNVDCDKTMLELTGFVYADSSETNREFAMHLHGFLVDSNEGLIDFLCEVLNEKERR